VIRKRDDNISNKEVINISHLPRKSVAAGASTILQEAETSDLLLDKLYLQYIKLKGDTSVTDIDKLVIFLSNENGSLTLRIFLSFHLCHFS